MGLRSDLADGTVEPMLVHPFVVVPDVTLELMSDPMCPVHT